jgi:hypothetical protein
MNLALPALTLEHLQHEARPYPSNLLPKKGTALGLFAAGFHGWNDIVWFSTRRPTNDVCRRGRRQAPRDGRDLPGRLGVPRRRRLGLRRAGAQEGRTWDVVSVDPFFGDDAPRAWDALYLWAGLARSLLTVTVKPDTHLNVPDGWEVLLFSA